MKLKRFNEFIIENKEISNLSNKQYIQVNTEEFKNWFGNSKVLDDNDEPLVVYHGTKGDFSIFSSVYKDKNFGKGDENGIFFTDEPGVASTYANFNTDARKAFDDWMISRNTKPFNAFNEYEAEKKFKKLEKELLFNQSVLPVFLCIDNPIIIDAEGRGFKDYFHVITDTIIKAKDNGNDGVIIKDFHDALGRYDNSSTHYVVFSPNQIKSAIGNNGKFDKNNPDINETKKI